MNLEQKFILCWVNPAMQFIERLTGITCFALARALLVISLIIGTIVQIAFQVTWYALAGLPTGYTNIITMTIFIFQCFGTSYFFQRTTAVENEYYQAVKLAGLAHYDQPKWINRELGKNSRLLLLLASIVVMAMFTQEGMFYKFIACMFLPVAFCYMTAVLMACETHFSGAKDSRRRPRLMWTSLASLAVTILTFNYLPKTEIIWLTVNAGVAVPFLVICISCLVHQQNMKDG